MNKTGPANGARWTTALFFVLSGLITASWASRIPDMQQQLGLSNAAWGTVLFATPVGQVAGLVGAGWLMARFGVQRVITWATVACASVLLLAGASGERGQLMAALFGLGLFRTLLNLSINTRATEVQKLFDRPILVTFHGLWSLACLAAGGIGTLMILAGWLPLQHFILIGGSAILLALLYEWRRNRGTHIPPQQRPLLVKPDRYLAILGAITFCGMLCENVMFDWSVNYFEKTVQAPRALVTGGYIAFVLAMTTGRLLGDRLMGRFGPIRLLQANGILMTAGFLLAAALPFVAPAILALLLIGLGDSIIVPVVYFLAARSRALSPAYALAAVTMIGYGGFLAGPLITGSVSELLGMQWAFALFATGGIAILLLTAKLQRRLQADAAA